MSTSNTIEMPLDSSHISTSTTVAHAENQSNVTSPNDGNVSERHWKSDDMEIVFKFNLISNRIWTKSEWCSMKRINNRITPMVRTTRMISDRCRSFIDATPRTISRTSAFSSISTTRLPTSFLVSWRKCHPSRRSSTKCRRSSSRIQCRSCRTLACQSSKTTRWWLKTESIYRHIFQMVSFQSSPTFQCQRNWFINKRWFHKCALELLQLRAFFFCLPPRRKRKREFSSKFHDWELKGRNICEKIGILSALARCEAFISVLGEIHTDEKRGKQMAELFVNVEIATSIKRAGECDARRKVHGKSALTQTVVCLSELFQVFVFFIAIRLLISDKKCAR